jgi:purine-binding chemotaxis protein CheW
MMTDEKVCAANRYAGKYLTFSIQGESYGIDVLQVREIIRNTQITSVPQAPAYVRGVINLRGKIIPVMDLRARLGFADAPDTQHTCMVVTELSSTGNRRAQIGMIVDQVEEVTLIAPENIEDPPDFGADKASGHILAMAKIKGSIKTLLNIRHVLGGEAALESLPEHAFNAEAQPTAKEN